MALPKFSEIVELIKKGSTIEAQEKIMELRHAMMDLQEENLALREQVSALREQIKEYENPKGEVCPSCHKRGWHVVESKKHPVMGDVGVHLRTYECSFCNFTEDRTEE